ncbi:MULTISPECIES: MetQ/NlpA family ABC transporter substrate-binding protein [unclassified Caballeronia]|uniref:MetQ/NlpA family ABC transporter substrate-binding protein n=1 Tax=unclassified Caballeronia TaxID=2646786 RepID=UPI00286368B7|nr:MULTISPECIES: MetQ/NlpA family ABC transporter substrate-binding protein [unclassified Caballeronia]MDR5739233.1 MetQ/NlpA family ABC transporter substrate-binding protein [Caballeronia sp. LZ016]MDR5807722.1 MetQ/NlpA family ABC transporter substrate-binding protein [Caballeronia sp. LZ019]
MPFALAITFAGAARADQLILKVGVTSGPHEEIFEAVKKVAERDYGLRIKIVSFNDYIQPDAALDAGDLDANSYQHRPFLASQIRARNYKLVGIGRTWIGPIGLYSRRYTKFSELPPGATIGIPNDPANESRILLLLQRAGAIKLRQGIDPVTGINATPLDVVSNPKQFRFKEVDAAQLPRTLDDFDATTVNADYAIKAGLNPARDTILKEDGSGIYACLIAVREQDAGKPWVQQLVAAYQSPEVRQFILSRYQGAIIPAF